MDNRGLLWGIGLGVAAALIILLLPPATLEAMVVGSGLSALLPAAAPPLGTTARFMLAALAFAIPTVIGALVGSQRDDDDLEEAFDEATPIPVAQPRSAPAVTAGATTAQPLASRDSDDIQAALARIEAMLAELPAQTTKAVKSSPSADLDKTLRSIQRALRKRLPDPALLNAARALQAEAAPESLIARVEAVEARIGEQLAEINARLASLTSSTPPEAAMPSVVRLPTRRPSGLASNRIGQTVADIRRSIESLNG